MSLTASSEEEEGADESQGPAGETAQQADEDPRIEPKTAVEGPAADGEDEAWREWLLVVAVVLATLVVPGLIYLRPPALPFEVAFLVLPLLPAVVLGATAVYVAVDKRRE